MDLILILIMLAVCVVMPLFYSARVIFLAEASKAGWFIVVADACVVVVLVFLVGRWDIAGVYTRVALLTLFLAAITWSFFRHRTRPWRPAQGGLRHLRSAGLTLVLFSAALVYVLSGMRVPPDARPMHFPLQGGHFIAVQAGAVKLLNYHVSHSEQRFASDFTAIYPSGFRTSSIMPESLDQYAIFGASVVSPCDGEIVSATSDLPDLIPPARDQEDAAGNHVKISCGDLNVDLAHFMQDSVIVRVGDKVTVGTPLGRVGNSGNTTEPHLHIHAYDPATGTGVPITFSGHFPVRNSAFQ